MNTPTGAGVARRYPAMTCGDTNETNDTDASPPFAMTPTLLAEAARLAMRNAGTGKGPANPLGRALAAGERREPLSSTQRNILDAVEELRCGKILPLERMKLLEWAQTDDDDDALIEVSRPMPSPSTVASLCAATFGILPLTPPSDDEASDGSYASDEVFSFDAKNKVEGRSREGGDDEPGAVDLARTVQPGQEHDTHAGGDGEAEGERGGADGGGGCDGEHVQARVAGALTKDFD